MHVAATAASVFLIAYQFVAKAESRLCIITEVIGGSVYLTLSLLGYHWGGLTGLGIAFTVDYLIYFLFVYIIAAKRYGFSFSKAFSRSYTLQFIIVAATLVCILLLPSQVKYWICATFLLASCAYALFMLERKMGIISQLFQSLTNKNK